MPRPDKQTTNQAGATNPRPAAPGLDTRANVTPTTPSTGRNTHVDTGTPQSPGGLTLGAAAIPRTKLTTEPTVSARTQPTQLVPTSSSAPAKEGLKLGQWNNNQTGSSLTNRNLTGERDAERQRLTTELETAQSDLTKMQTQYGHLQFLRNGYDPEEKSQPVADLEHSMWDLDQKIQKRNTEIADLQTRLDEVNKPIEWEGRQELIDELNRIDENSGWITDPDAANVMAQRRAEIEKTLQERDLEFGNGLQHYNDVDLAREVIGGASKDYASGMLNAAGTALAAAYEGADTNPYAGWATDELSAENIGYEHDENAMGDFRFVQTGAEKLQAAADRLGESAAADLESAKAGLGKFGQAGVDIATNIIQMGFDAATGVTGINPLAAMFIRSSGSASREARLAGADTSQQLMFGVAKGTIEAVTEKLLDGVAGIYGKGTADEITEQLIRKLTNSDLGRSALRLFIGAAGEGGEEVLSDVFSPLAEKLYKDESLKELYRQLEPSEVLYDFLIGAVIGGFGGAASIATGADTEKNAELRMQDNIDIIARALNLEETGESISNVNETANPATRVNREGESISDVNRTADNNVNRTGESLSNVNETREEDLNEEIEQDAAEEEPGLLEPEEAQQATAEDGLRVGEADNIETESEDGTAAADSEWEELPDGDQGWDAGERAGGEPEGLDGDAGTGGGEPEPVGEGRNAAGQSLGDALREAGEVEAQSSAAYLGIQNGTENKTFLPVPDKDLTPELKQVQYSVNMAAGAGVDFVAGPIEVKGADGETYRTSGIYNPETRRVTIQVDNAKYTPAEIADRQKFLIAAQRDPGLTDEIRDRIVERYGRSEMQRVLRNYIVNMRGAYDIGDGSIDAMDTAARTILNQVFADANAGINSFDADTRKYRFDTKNAMSQRADQQTGTEPKRERGKVRLATRPGMAGGVRYSAVNREGLSATQRATIRVAETIANATGLDIRVVDMGKGYGGEYFPGGGGVMYLNISASIGGRNIAVASMSHELTHWLQEYAADEYATLKQVVLDEIKKDPARYESIFTDREEAYGNIADLTEDQITDEMVANACQTVLMDPDTVRRIVSEQPTLAERIRNFIIRMIDDIKAAFSEMPDTDRSIFQEVKAAEGALDQIRETWLNAFDTAAENLKAEQGTNKKAATAGGVQYMSYKTAEQSGFEKLIDQYYEGKLNRNDPVYIGVAGGNAKRLLNSESPLIITGADLNKSTRSAGNNANYSAHGMDERFIRTLPERIDNAVMAYSEDGGKKFTYVLFNEYTGKLAVVGGNHNEVYEGHTVDRAKSIYDIGTPEAFLTKEGKDLVFTDNKEAENLLRRARIQTPGLQKILSHGHTIANQDEDVKGAERQLQAWDDIESEKEQEQIQRVQYSRFVEDPETLDFLDKQEEEGKVVHTYKSFLEIDGKLYPPMASMKKDENGKWKMTKAMEVGRWEEFVGDPSKIIVDPKNGRGYFNLKKDNGDTVKAAYNPYQHSSNLMLNDQFTGAYSRPNLVTYECIIPESELTSGYRAEYAKDPVGEHSWKAGPVAGKLVKAKGTERKVYLSRWLKPIRKVPDAEVAQHYKELLDGTDIAVPSNVVPPSLLRALEDAGVNIEYDERAPKTEAKIINAGTGAVEINRMLTGYEGGHNQFPVANGIVDEFVQNYKDRHQGQTQFQVIDDVAEEAVERFGTTKDFAEAGYVLRDGRMLRFTDQEHAGTRDWDHRAIGLAYGADIDLTKNHGFSEEAGKYLNKFVESGNIRFEAGDLDLAMDAGIQVSSTVPLTREQEETIRNFIEWKKEREENYHPGENSLYRGPLALHVDFGGDADTAAFAANVWDTNAKSYYGDIDADQVIRDIKHYYRAGSVRPTSTVAQFHGGFYQIINEREKEAEQLTEDVQEYFRNVDEDSEFFMDEDEILDAMFFDPYRDPYDGDMSEADEVLQCLSELSADQTGAARRKTYELMERIVPHLSAVNQNNWTGDGNENEVYDERFTKWYSKRHPSLYYPGYQPGDLFDRGGSDDQFWTAQDNKEKERNYLNDLLEDGKLMEPELSEARRLLDRLDSGNEVFYQAYEDLDVEIRNAQEERDALQERLNGITERDGVYYDGGEEITEEEIRSLVTELQNADDRYRELQAIPREEQAAPAEEPEPEGLTLGAAEEPEEVPFIAEDERDRTIRELQAANRDLEKYAENWRKQASITGEGEETAKRSDVKRVTKELIEHADYQGDKTELQRKVQALADMVVSNNRGSGLNWNEIRAAAREIADNLVDNSYTILDPEADTRNAIKAALKEMKIRPDAMWTGDFGDWENFRRQNIGTLVFSREGRSIDDVYKELRGSFGDGLFPADITAGSDQVNQIIKALDSLRPQQSYNFADDTEAEMASDYYTNRITDEVLFGDIREELTKADRNYRRVKERMRKAEEQLKKVKRESNQRIQDLQRMQRHEIRGALEKQRADARAREERQKIRKNIDKTGKRLIKYLTENSGKNPIPEPLKEAVGKVLLDLDLSSGMEKHRKERYLRDMQDVGRIVTQQNAYMAGQTDKWEGLFLDLPSDIQQELNEHLANVQAAMDEAEARGRVWNPNMMNLEELQRLDEILTVLSSAITNANEILSDARGAKISEEAAEGIREIDALGADKRRSNRAEKLNRFLRFQNTTPYYFFKRLGAAGQRMFERIQDGWDKFAFNARQVVDFANETYSKEEAKEIQETVFEFNLRRRGDLSDGFDKPEKVTMTKAQIMSLYCLWKREQAQGHLLGAGIRIADYKDGKNNITQAENYLLDLDDVMKIISKLTDRDRQIADALQKYMNTVGSDWGNEVSMKRFGIRSFTEENYFPISTDDRTRPVRNPESDQANLYRLLNMSFTKATTRGASNSVVIDNIFDVFANHMADMAKYNGLGLPMLDAMKWVSYSKTSELSESGQYGYESVQKSMDRAFGKEARNYFTAFMKDLNGVREGGRGEEFGSRLLSSYKVAAVGANLRVAVLQPTSFMRASAVLDKKYLLQGLKGNNKQAQEEATKYSGTANWKDMGFYDTNINAGLREMIKHTGGVTDDIREKSMKLAETMDKVTWGALWNACKAEQEDKGFAGEELMQATAERFREVVYRTQVMDSTMTRSHVMRQKGTYAGMVTAFMSEPTLSYNMLLDAYNGYEDEVRKNMDGKDQKDQKALKAARDKAWEKSKDAVGKAVSAYMATAILSAIVESLVDAARDDDEYSTYLERFLEKFTGVNLNDPDATAWEIFKGFMGGNFMEDLMLHNKVPIVKDFFAALSGNSTNRMDIEAFGTLVKAAGIAWESIALAVGWQKEPTKLTYNGNMTTWGKIYNILRGVSQMSGLPLGNATRDLIAIWNTTVGEIASSAKIQTYDPGAEKSIQYAVQDGYLTEEEAVQLLVKKEIAEDEEEAKQMAFSWANPKRYERMLTAMNAGDKEEFQAAKQELEDLRFKHSGISAAVIGDVEKQYLGQEDREPIDRASAVKLLMDYGGMVERAAEAKVQRWTCELETGIPYSGIGDAYVDGDITAKQAKEMLMEYGDMAEEKAEAQVQKWKAEIDTGIAYGEIGDSLLYGDITKEEAIQMLMKYGGKSQEDAEDYALQIMFQRDYGMERDRVTLQDMYINGEFTRDEMKQIMLDYSYSNSEESAENSLIRWDFIGNDMSLDEVTPWQAKKWFSDLEDADIDKQTYLDFVNQVKDVKGEVGEDGKTIPYSKMDKVLAIIDSLDLTPEQKDALALAGWDSNNDGYSEKNLARAPWHDGSTSGSGSKKKSSGGRRGGGGGRRGGGGGRRGGGSGGGLNLGNVEVVEHSDDFDEILRRWRKRKLTRKQILQLVKEGKLTQEEADEILGTAQDGAEGDEDLLKDTGLKLGAAEEDLLKKY